MRVKDVITVFIALCLGIRMRTKIDPLTDGDLINSIISLET
jgi:hypothetical protein